MINPQTNSIKKKLTRMSMLASFSAMLLASAAFVLYELITFRMAMVRGLTTQAQIIGSNSVTALTFADPRSAETTLSALKAEPSILSAGLYDRSGRLFASYRRDPGVPSTGLAELLKAPKDTYQFRAGRLLLFHAIVFEGERVGTVYIQSDLEQLYARLEQYALIGSIVLVASLLVALVISSRLQRPISGTVLHLAETAQGISSNRDYSVRATPPKDRDELSLLTDTFNEMLSQIQQRDEALDRARQEVEVRVQERTAELQASEERFRSVAETANDAFISANREGNIIHWNNGAERIFGYDAAEVLGKPLTLIMPQSLHTAHRQGMQRYLTTGDSHVIGKTVELTGRRKDGNEFPLDLSLASWKTREGTFFTGVIRDITKQKRTEEEIRKLNEGLQYRNDELAAAYKELEAFTYSVSHDLRAPLRHIDGFSKLLAEEYSAQLPEKAREYLSLIRDGTREMGQLVDDLLNLARLGRKEIVPQITGLDSLAGEVIAGLKRENTSRAIEWKVQKLPFVECDPGLIRQVFANLLSNAAKYTRPREPAVIEVGQLEQNGERVIFVRDNGVGFNMKNAEKLFGVFQRLHRQEDFEGTGVGLATVQRIIHKHGGRVWAEAELDRGATFYFTLGMLEHRGPVDRPAAGGKR